MAKMMEGDVYTRVVALMAGIGWLMGVTTALVLRVSFGNAVNTFNDAAEDGGGFVAVLGNGFTSESFLSGSPSDGAEERNR